MVRPVLQRQKTVAAQGRDGHALAWL